MSALDDLQKQLQSLTRGEKAQLLQWVARDIGDSFPGIESMPGVCGGEPCIVRTRIPVWVLEQLRRQGVSEAVLLRSYPTLRAEDLANAWAYVRAHREEVEQQIQENEGDAAISTADDLHGMLIRVNRPAWGPLHPRSLFSPHDLSRPLSCDLPSSRNPYLRTNAEFQRFFRAARRSFVQAFAVRSPIHVGA